MLVSMCTHQSVQAQHPSPLPRLRTNSSASRRQCCALQALHVPRSVSLLYSSATAKHSQWKVSFEVAGEMTQSVIQA